MRRQCKVGSLGSIRRAAALLIVGLALGSCLSACASDSGNALRLAKEEVVKSSKGMTAALEDRARASSPASFEAWLRSGSSGYPFLDEADGPISPRMASSSAVVFHASGEADSTLVSELIVVRSHSGSGDTYRTLVAYSCATVKYFSRSAKKPTGQDVPCPESSGIVEQDSRVKLADWLTAQH
jgi:hypothetical protein